MQLPAQLIIQVIEDWFEQFQKDWSPGSPCELDGSGVERIDTAGLQCLVAINKNLMTQGMSLSWTGVSDTLTQNAKRLGVEQLINLPDHD
jgi:ABC-type transporter Mla MlaB component